MVVSRSMMIKSKEHPLECVWFIIWPARFVFSLCIQCVRGSIVGPARLCFSLCIQCVRGSIVGPARLCFSLSFRLLLLLRFFSFFFRVMSLWHVPRDFLQYEPTLLTALITSLKKKDESMQDEAEEGRRPPFRKSENQPSSQEVQERMKTHIPHRSWCAHWERNDPHMSRGGGRRGPRNHRHLAIDYGFLKASNPDDPADQESNPILIGAEAKYGLTLAMAVPGKGQCCTMVCEACGGLVGQSNSHFEV